MKEQTKVEYAATGCVTFVRAMAHQHHVPLKDLYETVSKLCIKETVRLSLLEQIHKN